MQTSHGILYFDEIDKLTGTAGAVEVQHGLLNVLDFTQNSEFSDQYFDDIPIDLSHLFFTCSMNKMEGLDPAFRDRLHIIQVSGYDATEKVEILKRYGLKRSMSNLGLKDGEVVISDEVLRHIVSLTSAGKSGMRETNRLMDQILRKINLYRQLAPAEMELTFKISGFTWPLCLSCEMVDEIIQREKETKEYLHIYS